MRLGGGRAPLAPGGLLFETLVLLSIIGTFSGLQLLWSINLSVDSTSNDTEDHGTRHGVWQRDRCIGLAALVLKLRKPF